MRIWIPVSYTHLDVYKRQAVKWLAAQESDDAEFLYDNIASSESISQVILALCALERDPEKDETFTKKESTLLDALAKFRKEDGIYMHEKADEEGSAMEMCIRDRICSAKCRMPKEYRWNIPAAKRQPIFRESATCMNRTVDVGAVGCTV